MSVPYQRLWTIESARLPRGPAEVVWEADSAKEILAEATARGFVVRGPYVLESPGSDLTYAAGRRRVR